MTKWTRNLLAGGDAPRATGLAAGPDDNSLAIALGEELPGFDGYISTSRDGVVVTRHIFDMLIYRNLRRRSSTSRCSATEWRRIDDLTWEFDLRPGRRLPQW